MILITGGLGFIGLHTARRFLDVGEKVVLTHYRVRREPDFIKAEVGKSVFIEPRSRMVKRPRSGATL